MIKYAREFSGKEIPYNLFKDDLETLHQYTVTQKRHDGFSDGDLYIVLLTE